MSSKKRSRDVKAKVMARNHANGQRPKRTANGSKGWDRIRPLRNLVVLEYEEAEHMTDSGLLHLPQVAQKNSHFARVLAVGPGRVNEDTLERMPMTVGVGMRVVVPHLNFPIKVDGREIFIVNEDAILMYGV